MGDTPDGGFLSDNTELFASGVFTQIGVCCCSSRACLGDSIAKKLIRVHDRAKRIYTPELNFNFHHLFVCSFW
ncbi:hypothetical protein TcWFU_001140 [Taenia crassiceps]|uniref:Uncharacterized protein n=1 Tax=Taenia crassiceps TaxID=6207 RepID=A0ABR4Q618_9CEST